MRNLKRALSLTLASVMLLGMMVVGSSAASYPDVSDEDNVEAIEVLQKVAVMEGDNNGNFNPDDYVTREQMAVIMSKLLKLDYNYYQGTNPFSDVPAWAAPYVAACAANGITSGIGGGMYGAGQNVSAVQAALMMLKALGYFQYQQDFGDSYILATVKQATEVGLFDGIDSNANQALTRNEVAQMALNALQSEMVTFTGNPGVEYTGSNGESWIGGYKAEYTPRTSTESKYQAIERRTSDVAGGNNLNRGQYYIQLGEELYNGILRLNDRTLDAFGRPSRTWTYDGNEIGTYAKKELLVESYTTGVKGRTLYELLTQATIRDYELAAYLDGALNGHNNDSAYSVRKDYLVRSNNTNQNGSARGVLTEVYVDNDWEEITIVSINTYLAQANSDYNETSETVSLSVYYSGDTTSTNVVTTLVDKEDVEDVVNLKKDDWVLINWADETFDPQNKVVQKIMTPEIKEDVTVTSFTRSQDEDAPSYDKVGVRVTKITADGTTYENNTNAWYKRGTLYDYNNDELVNKTYTLYMDQYGNFIGAELYSGQAQYVFITGYDRPQSNLSVSTAKAGAIFTDGTMAAIDVNVKDTNSNITSYRTNPTTNTTYPAGDYHLKYELWATHADDGKPLENMWYTYTVRNDVYTLSPAKGFTYSENTSGKDETINCSNVRLTHNDTNHFGSGRSYGEDASVYITVRTGDVDTRLNATEFDPTKAITEVSGMYTGVQNVNLVYGSTPNRWVHAVYDPDDNNMIIAAIILGEAEGIVDNYAYIRKGAYNETYDAANDVHYWDVDVILNGELVTKQIKSRFANTVNTLRVGYVQELVLDPDGYITKINNVENTNGTRLIVVPGGNKVYDETDYANTTRSSADVLKNFDIYDLQSNATVRSGNFTNASGATVYYVEPVYQGRTLYITNSDNDIGLDFVSDAKAIVRQTRNNDTKYVAYNTVAEAVNNLADAYVANNVTAANGKQFNGRIVAVLNKDGVAEWVFFDDYTPINSTDPNYGGGTTTVTGQKINGYSTVARVSELLENDNVVITSNWTPTDRATNSTIVIPEGRTLTIQGDFNAYNGGTNPITVLADGEGSTMGKLVVTGTLTLAQDVYFPVSAGALTMTGGSNPNNYQIDSTVSVTRAVTLNSTVLTVNGTLTAASIGQSGSGSKLVVYGDVTCDNLTVSAEVYSDHTLTVNRTVSGSGVTVTVGGTVDGTNYNGRAVIANLANNATLAVVRGDASVKDSKGTVTVTATTGALNVDTVSGGTVTGNGTTSTKIDSVTGGTVSNATVQNATAGTIKSGTVTGTISKDATIQVENTDTLTLAGTATLNTSKVTVASGASLVLKAGSTIGANSNVVVNSGDVSKVTGTVGTDKTIQNKTTENDPIEIGNVIETPVVKNPFANQPTGDALITALEDWACMANIVSVPTVTFTASGGTGADSENPAGTVKLSGTVTPVTAMTVLQIEAYSGNDIHTWDDFLAPTSAQAPGGYDLKNADGSLKTFGFIIIQMEGGINYVQMVQKDTDGLWKQVRRPDSGVKSLNDKRVLPFNETQNGAWYTIDYTGLK